jgi:hypothetical protein
MVTMRFIGGPLDGQTMETPDPPPDSFASTEAGTYDLCRVEPSPPGVGATAIYRPRVATGKPS